MDLKENEKGIWEDLEGGKKEGNDIIALQSQK